MSSVSGEPRHPPVVSSVCTDHGIYSGTLIDPISANVEQGQRRRNSASSSSSSVTDTSDPAVRRVVYNLYRGLLGTYNDKANDIISAMPPEMVREDHGIAKHIESMIRQSEEIKSGVSRRNSSGNISPFLPAVKGIAYAPPVGRPIEITNMDAQAGLGSDGEVAVQSTMAGPPPPPPPPPPPMPSSQGPSSMPSIRINTETRGGPNSAGRGGGGGGGKHVPGGGAPFSYIPPSAIQNAMMTKDKKPFTYTPGGIDFLAEIRSPRMQRRISKNAADEGVSSHPQQTATNAAGSSPTPSHLSPQTLMAMQPQVAVPVFPPMPQPVPVLHSPAIHLPVTPSTPTAMATSPQPATPPHQNYGQQLGMEPAPPQPVRVTLKPAVPQFLQSQPQTQSPEQMFEDIMNSLSARNAGSQAQSPIPASYASPQPVVVAPASVTPAVAAAVSSPERRNTQLGSIYIPPVNSNVTSGVSNPNNSNGVCSTPGGPLSPLATSQLAKAPMPWMNSQNRLSNSPNPAFVNNQQHERVIPVEREDNVKASPTVASTSGNVRLVPIAVEGAHAAPVATRAPPTPQRTVSVVKEETVHPPWHNAQDKVIPIYMESAGPATTAGITPLTVQRQPDAQQSNQPQSQQQAPWRTQAAANANQIASMMEELMMSPANNGRQQHEQQDSHSNPLTAGSYSRAASVEQPRGQPTQSRSFRILQMIHDPADDSADADAEPTESSGRLSRSSVGSNNSGGMSGGRASQHSGPPPVGERRLNLTQDDRELMDMFRSQVNEEQSLHQEVDPRYRGSHIPSRAFRMLQNFTATDSSAAEDAYHQQQQMNRAQGNNAVPSNAPGAANRGPPSEQSEPEPKKYMGGNIPSRSFRMLQAMTSLDPNADMERVFMTSRSPQLVDRSDSVESCQLPQKNGKTDEAAITVDHAMPSPNESQHEPRKVNGHERANANKADEAIASSSNPTPAILIDNYEEEATQAEEVILATAAEDQQSEMNASDHSGLTNNGAEMKRGGDHEADIDTESETTHHHSRLLRLLSGDLGTDGARAGESGALSATTSTPSASETEATFLPPNLPGVRLRIRSLRAKDRIPSRVFRSLQHEFDSSTEDITQAVISSPPPFSPNHSSQLTSGFIGHSGFFRYSRLYASVTPETPSSATSELDGFFSHHQNHLH